MTTGNNGSADASGYPHQPDGTQPGAGQPYPGQAYPGQAPYGQPHYGAPGQAGPYPYPGHQPHQQYDPNTPYLQQPVQQQYFAQPHAAPVQYVVQAQSLKGLKGWLLFFVIWTGFSALSLGSQLPWAYELHGAAVHKIFIPILLIVSVAAIATTAMELRIAKWIFIGLAIGWFLYYVLTAIDASADLAMVGDSAVTTVVITMGLFAGFVTLYFLTSKRVKETLVK